MKRLDFLRLIGFTAVAATSAAGETVVDLATLKETSVPIGLKIGETNNGNFLYIRKIGDRFWLTEELKQQPRTFLVRGINFLESKFYVKSYDKTILNCGVVMQESRFDGADIPESFKPLIDELRPNVRMFPDGTYYFLY